jgi:hypothetical protein
MRDYVEGAELNFLRDPVLNFAIAAQTAELLLFLDRASLAGAHYPVTEVVKIIETKMANHNLKSYLLFHLTQSLLKEAGPTSNVTPPVLIVRSALGNVTTLLEEAIKNKSPLHAIVATVLDGADTLFCAFVTVVKFSDFRIYFDLTNPPEKPELAK